MDLKVTANGIFMTDVATMSRLSARTKREVRGMIKKQMGIIQANMRGKLFPWRSHGRQYPSRRARGGIHTASLPGYPPNQDTGKLRKGINVVKKDPDNLLLVSRVPPPNPDYGIYLEFGSNVGGKLQPRPFFYKTIQETVRSRAFKFAIRQVGYAIRNELEAQNGILKRGKWEVTK